MRFISTSRQRPEVLQLLPLRPPTTAGAGEGAAKGTTEQYEFSPDAATLLAELLPETVTSTLWQIFSDAVVSEHVSRMIAMKAATDNAGKMGKSLSRRYNRARQSQITTELTEIISGAAAAQA
jgi:F-type H+-transporting ATPase subunit gamma